MDNSSAFEKGVAYLAEKYCINHINISGYNSCANGLVECSHFDVWQALFKAVDGDEYKWFQAVYSVFWSERITTQQWLGCSPDYTVTGVHPIVPLNIAEATFLPPPPSSILLTTQLIARHAIALQKCWEHLKLLHLKMFAAWPKQACQFKWEHGNTIWEFNFKQGDLVLARNTKIEKSLNRKMRPRYIGPLIVISRNRGGAYILAKLNGVVFNWPFAQFRVIAYFSQTSIPIPDLNAVLNISREYLHEMEELEIADPKEDNPIAEDTWIKCAFCFIADYSVL